MSKETVYGFSRKVLTAIIDAGKKHDVDLIVLFGSRARGDYQERSDIDLAVYGEHAELFGLDLEEQVPTLLKFDVVNMSKPVQEALQEAVQCEGVVIYEKV